MLLRPYDVASEREWRQLLLDHGFGQLIVPGAGRAFPVVAPTHFAFDGERTVWAHFARENPVFAALAERPEAMLTVLAAYTYVPSDWNAGEEAPPEWGVPTSYYATVQVSGPCRVVDDDAEMASMLARLLGRFQPEGGHRPVEPGDNPYGRQFPAIRGVELTIADVRAKTKFGGNRPRAHRDAVEARLRERGEPLDLEAAELMRAKREGR